MKERAESLKLIATTKPRWPQVVFSRWPPLWSQRGGSQASHGGETGGTRRLTVPARTGSSSPESTRQRPLCNCADAMYVVLSTEFNKSYQGQRGVCPLEDGSQVGVKIAGRLTLFCDNWAKVTQDHWVLDTVQGYRFKLLGKPVKTVPPREVHTSSLEQNLIQEEIQK